MENVLITGAMGTVGSVLAHKLIGRSSRVRALVRSPERAARLLPPAIEPFRGDVTDAESVRAAMQGCDTVFHAAGLAEQWLRDSALFERVNVLGTRHMVTAALAEGVKRFVYTSTIDVFQCVPGRSFNESLLEQRPLGTRYERSKQAADLLVTEAIERGLPARFVHPSAVYGPGSSYSLGLNRLICELARNKVPFLPPGGMPVVFSRDVAVGQLLAADSPTGTRWILSDRYMTLRDIAKLVSALVPSATVPRPLPGHLATIFAVAGETVSRVTRRPPLLSAGELHFLRSHSLPDASFAQSLGWRVTPITEGFAQTLRGFGEIVA